MDKNNQHYAERKIEVVEKWFCQIMVKNIMETITFKDKNRSTGRSGTDMVVNKYSATSQLRHHLEPKIKVVYGGFVVRRFSRRGTNQCVATFVKLKSMGVWKYISVLLSMSIFIIYVSAVPELLLFSIAYMSF